MAAQLIEIRRPAMHAGDLLTHPPPQLLAIKRRHDASVGAGIRWMGRRTSPARRTARPLGVAGHLPGRENAQQVVCGSSATRTSG